VFIIEPMILPRLRLAGGRHRCHNSGGSHVALQGDRSRDFPSALASSKQRHQPAAAQKQPIGIVVPPSALIRQVWNLMEVKLPMS
jgi:hypothetical protein